MSNLSTAAAAGPVPVASYARTSEDSRKRDAHGVRNQLRLNERTACAYGCTVVEAYTDNGRSASKDGVKRPGFDRLVRDLTRGATISGAPLQGVVCVADDRLYRRAEDFARYIAALTSHPGRIHVDPRGVRDPYSKEGLLQAVRSLESAAEETQVRSQRLQDWHWARAVDGLPHSGPRPFGWLDNRIALHPVEAELVARAIIDRLGGKAVRAIARGWDELGVTGTRGGRPNAQTVTQIMTAPRVCGYRANRGALLVDPVTGQPVLGLWEPIVTPDQWQAVCATFSPGSLYLHRGSGAPRLTNKTSAPRHLGSGFLRCGAERPDGTVCRSKLRAQKGRSKKSPHVYGCGRCGRCAISGPLADGAIESLLFPKTEGRVRLPGSMHMRWQSGLMKFEEKRKIIASVFTCFIVRPGAKGNPTWDYSRVEPVWRWADRVAGVGSVL
ncbi:recombinase family protein [Streptomyces sp. PSKA54]|uniref:Recombinase family protein n=1 Tax=Streptomyces himalayensis subsp. aureolus TaxID=2758039 RepID=A0A7W2CY21_9ACTN|nr:recombinase family protein [Streptomyces himalayensis]MBA4861203.1 recombinase family protein [Streptomyces himalayensis subsp. aureolus]